MPHDYLSRHVQTSGVEISRYIDRLINEASASISPNAELYKEMLTTVVRMAQADRNRWDAKIMLQTLREMESAFAALEPFKRRRKVSVFGSARTKAEHALYQQAKALGQQLARYDFMVITGAGGGIMAAAHEGAGLDHSLGLNITLPFEQYANPTVHDTAHLLSFHFFFLRKLFFVKEADALVLCPGGFGTLDEALEVLTLIQTGKSPLVPIVLLDEPNGTYWQDLLGFFSRQLEDNGYILVSDLKLMRLTTSVDQACQEIARFYQNFHSSRWLNNRFVMRLKHPLNSQALELINRDFTDLCLAGGFTLEHSCQGEEDEPELCALPRIGFAFNGRDYGRLRELIDTLNQPQHWA